MLERYGYLKTVNGIRRLEIPAGFAGVHAPCLCGFSPQRVQPDEAVEHTCPDLNDPDVMTIREIYRSRWVGFTLRAPTPEEHEVLSRLEPAIHARYNKPFTLPENPVLYDGELL